MFVHNVHLMKRAKIEVPSVVRFYIAENEIKESGTGGINAALGQRIFKLINGRVYGKFGAQCIGGDSYIDGLKPRIIQSGLKVVDSIPDDTCNLWQIAESGQAVMDALNSGLTVNLNSASLTLWASNEVYSLPNLRDVLIGPVDLQARISKDHASAYRGLGV